LNGISLSFYLLFIYLFIIIIIVVVVIICLPPNVNYRIVKKNYIKENGEEAQRNYKTYTAWASSTQRFE